ncbi:MAG: hypothetical protein JWQ35_2725 [Bacteriovoracaceae bacterium]|nr:hypothetical protein [Bacteriovoracaceae bacterium]
MRTLIYSFLVLLYSAPNYATNTEIFSDKNTASIEKITGLKGKLNEAEHVFKVSSPRSDVNVSVDGFKMPPFMGLTSWAAFTGTKEEKAMVMGDLVLFEDEVNPVMSTLLKNHIDVTALHNHFTYEDPKVYFMHIGGEGKLDALAKGIRSAFDEEKKIRTKNPQPLGSSGAKALPEKNSITSVTLEKILKVSGQSQDGMFKAVFGRDVKMSCGCEAGKEMGVNTWSAFAGSDENAVVDGDFAVWESELQSILRSLRDHGIQIVAIHQHMTNETPRTLFLHYWGRGKADDLAKAIRATLDIQKSKN